MTSEEINEKIKGKVEHYQFIKYKTDEDDINGVYAKNDKRETIRMIVRCSRYLRDYEHKVIHKNWYDKICAICENEEESDFLTDVLNKGYQVKASFLLFQESNASKDNIESFEKAYFSTTPGIKIPELWHTKYVYEPGKDKKNITDEAIYGYFQDSMTKRLKGNDIKYDKIKQNNDIIITMVKKSNNKYITIKIKNIGYNKDERTYKLENGEIRSVWAKEIQKEINKRMKNTEHLIDDDKPKVIFDTEGENNLYFVKLARYIAWWKYKKKIYICM